MQHADLHDLSAMPLASPGYPRGPDRFVDRRYLIITYLSDPDAIRAQLPEPLQPDGSNSVLFEFIKMPDSSGFDSHTESGTVIPARYDGEAVNFTSQMYLDIESPISGGREIWGVTEEARSADVASARGHADRNAELCGRTRRPGQDALQMGTGHR